MPRLDRRAVVFLFSLSSPTSPAIHPNPIRFGIWHFKVKPNKDSSIGSFAQSATKAQGRRSPFDDFNTTSLVLLVWEQTPALSYSLLDWWRLPFGVI